MNKRIAVVYESKTGNTKFFAEKIAEKLDCPVFSYKDISVESLRSYDVVIFGSRLIAGRITKLNSMIGDIHNAGVRHFIIFATGASPSEESVLEKMWKANLNETELKEYPHFYFPAGINYEALNPVEYGMLKTYAFVLKHKKKNSDYEREAAQMVQSSYDIKDTKEIEPLIKEVESIELD